MKAAFAWMLVVMLPAFPALAQNATDNPPLIVEEVQCRGNESTSCRFISGHLFLAAGDPINEEEIQNAKLRLSSLPYFESVDIYLEKGSRKGAALVVVEVAEAGRLQTELIAGMSARVDRLGQVIAGRLVNQNLFGTGNILDLQLSARTPISGPLHRVLISRLQLADPAAFDSSRYFTVGGVSALDTRQEFKNGDFYDIEQLSMDVAVGRRIWDFSYLVAGFQYAPVSSVASARGLADGTIDTEFEGVFETGVFVGFGWNSEDNPYFPTRGSRLFLSLGSTQFSTHFRKTWRMGAESLWTLRLGATPPAEYRSSQEEQLALGVMFARRLAPNVLGARRGRWYVDLSTQSLPYGQDGDNDTEIGLKAGIRFETAAFGLVELYVLGSMEQQSGVRQ